MDEFVTLSQAFFPSVKVGDPTAADTVCGPLISERHRSRVEGYVQRAVASGARIVAGGGRPDIPHGWYMNPTLIAGVNNSDEICREELFGPVGLVLPYRDVDDAIAICNDSHLGLAAAIFGPTEQAKTVANRLRVGSVYINGGGRYSHGGTDGWSQTERHRPRIRRSWLQRISGAATHSMVYAVALGYVSR